MAMDGGESAGVWRLAPREYEVDCEAPEEWRVWVGAMCGWRCWKNRSSWDMKFDELEAADADRECDGVKWVCSKGTDAASIESDGEAIQINNERQKSR